MGKWTKYCKCGKYIDHLETFDYEDNKYFFCWYCKLYFDSEGNETPFEKDHSMTFDEILKTERNRRDKELERIRIEADAKRKEAELAPAKEREKESEERKREQERRSEEIIKTKITYFYYLAPKQNIQSILRNGILSRNEALSRKLIMADLSWEGPQDRRDKKDVKLTNGEKRRLHYLVPLYFNYDTPNNFRMWQKNKEVALICVTKQILFSAEVSYAFSDGNMANNVTEPYSDLSELDFLPWDVINAPYCDYNDPENKRKRMSELLVYPEVNLKFIEKIIVPTNQMKLEIETMPISEGLQIFVEVNPAFFG